VNEKQPALLFIRSAKQSRRCHWQAAGRRKGWRFKSSLPAGRQVPPTLLGLQNIVVPQVRK